MATEDGETLSKIVDEKGGGAPANTFFTRRNCCCFHFPCFGSHASMKRINLGSYSTTSSFWERIRAAENEDKWWKRPLSAFKKVREWSEIVAGPEWKNFIRRINRNRNGNHVKFQYDPLSYALNFDEGLRENAEIDEDYGYYPDFASRFCPSSKVPPVG